MNATPSIVPHAPAELSRYVILREVSDALRTAEEGVTTLQGIVATTRVSNRDVVREFGDMSGLVSILAEMLALSILGPLDICTTRPSLLEKLHAFGTRCMDEHSGLRLNRLSRLVLTETTKNAEVGRAFYERGPGLLAAGLARFFRAAQYAGVLPADDSRRLASHFMAFLEAARGACDSSNHGGSNSAAHEGTDIECVIGTFLAGVKMDRHDALSAL